MRFQKVAVGGTFDGLHKGHQMLLERAFAVGDLVTIGLTSEAYIKRFKKGNEQHIGSFAKRKKALINWLQNQGWSDRVNIVPLDNIYGPTLLGDYQAIVVTKDSKKNALVINEARKERGLTPLEIVEIPLVAADDSMPISSSRVRSREIDGDGHLIMPDSLRPLLQKPLGRIITDNDIIASIDAHRGDVIVTVGDITTKTLLDAGHIPHLAIIDNQVNRKPFGALIQQIDALELPIVNLKSGPGFLSRDALDFLEKWDEEFKKNPFLRMVLIIDGEEDLLALPAIGHAPIGAIVYYGQPPSSGVSGLVEVQVTRQKKKEVALLLGQFS